MTLRKNLSIHTGLMIAILSFSQAPNGLANDTPQQAVNRLNQSLNGSFTGKYGTGLTNRARAYSNNSGYGVLIRNMMDGDPLTGNGKASQVVGTFLHNDMSVPNQVYPYGESYPEFQNPTLVSVYDLNPNPNDGVTARQPFGPEIYEHMTNAHEYTWGYLVSYAHDSNSLDKRAYPSFKEWNYINPNDHSLGTHPNTNGSSGYDGPHAWASKITSGTSSSWPTFVSAASKTGTADKRIGNPDAFWHENPTANQNWLGTPYGAGAGIHVDYNYDQVKSGDSQAWSGQGLKKPDGSAYSWKNVHDYGNQKKIWRQDDLMGWWGEMNYQLKGSDHKWIDYIEAGEEFATAVYNHDKDNVKRMQYVQDLLLPWVNNFRDTINLSQALFDNRNKANGVEIEPEKYVGWTEVPFSRDTHDHSQISDEYKENLFAIVLPQVFKNDRNHADPQISSSMNEKWYNITVGDQLGMYEQQGFLGVGSWVAVLQQGLTHDGYYFKQFEIQDFTATSSSGKRYDVQNGFVKSIVGIPEPSGMTLALASLIFLGRLGRRRSA